MANVKTLTKAIIIMLVSIYSMMAIQGMYDKDIDTHFEESDEPYPLENLWKLSMNGAFVAFLNSIIILFAFLIISFMVVLVRPPSLLTKEALEGVVESAATVAQGVGTNLVSKGIGEALGVDTETIKKGMETFKEIVGEATDGSTQSSENKIQSPALTSNTQSTVATSLSTEPPAKNLFSAMATDIKIRNSKKTKIESKNDTFVPSIRDTFGFFYSNLFFTWSVYSMIWSVSLYIVFTLFIYTTQFTQLMNDKAFVKSMVNYYMMAYGTGTVFIMGILVSDINSNME